MFYLLSIDHEFPYKWSVSETSYYEIVFFGTEYCQAVAVKKESRECSTRDNKELNVLEIRWSGFLLTLLIIPLRFRQSIPDFIDSLLIGRVSAEELRR